MAQESRVEESRVKESRVEQSRVEQSRVDELPHLDELPPFPCNNPHVFLFAFLLCAGLMCRCSRCRRRAWPRASPTGRLLLRLCSGSMKVLLRPHEGCIKARLRVYECSNLRALGVERHLVARDLSDYEKLAVAIATQVTLTHTHSHSLTLTLSVYAHVLLA